MSKRFTFFVRDDLNNNSSVIESVKTVMSEHDEIVKIEDINPETLNRYIPGAGRYFAICAKDVHLLSNSLDEVELMFKKDTSTAIVYSDYFNKAEVRLLDYANDWTERWNFGKIRFYSTKDVIEAGLFDKKNKFMFHYQMMLKLWRKKNFKHISEVLYEYRDSAGEVKSTDSKKKLFFPAEGEYGGFSYLYYTPEINKEVEKIFFDFLKREKIFFNSEPSSLVQEESENNDILVSVIIPVHNRAKLIKYAVESVLFQTIDKWELIIIDNNSDDRTCEIIEEYMKSDRRIKLIKRPDNRIAKALNDGLRHAKGKYIAQLDSDDIYSENTLKEMTCALDKDRTAGLAVSYYDLIDEEGELIEDMGIVKHEEYSVNNILRVDGAGAVRVWRRSVLYEMGLFNEDKYCDYGEDYDMVLKVTEKYKLIRVHKVLYHYRRHPDNSDMKRSDQFKLDSKNGARMDAYKRRKELLSDKDN